MSSAIQVLRDWPAKFQLGRVGLCRRHADTTSILGYSCEYDIWYSIYDTQWCTHSRYYDTSQCDCYSCNQLFKTSSLLALVWGKWCGSISNIWWCMGMHEVWSCSQECHKYWSGLSIQEWTVGCRWMLAWYIYYDGPARVGWENYFLVDIHECQWSW